MMGWQDRAYNRDNTGGIPPVQFRFPPISPLALWLIVACTVIFFVQVFTGGGAQGVGRLEEYGSLTFIDGLGWKQPWRFITYQYLHGGVVHLFFNMLGVYFFMPSLELYWGRAKAFAFYTLGGVVSGIVFAIFSLLWKDAAFLVGASGSILAILGAVALLFPDRQIILLFFPVPIRMAALLLAVLFAATAIAEGDLSNAAHLGGLAFGFLTPWLAGPFLADKQRQWKKYQAERELQDEISEQQEVDRILAKVADSGMNSLSASEKRALARATENQRRRDAEREKKVRAKW